MRRPLVILVTALLSAAFSLTSTGSAQASAGGIRLESYRLSISPPTSTRPLWEQCAIGGPNHPYCGLGSAWLTLSGFDAYGGIPECGSIDEDGYCADEEPSSLAHVTGGTFGTRMDVVVRCDGEFFPRFRSVPVVTEPVFGPNAVDAASRIDSDSAEVLAMFFLPSPSDIGACPEPDTTNLYYAAIRNLTVGFASETDDLPSWTTRVPGYHRVALS